METAFFKPLKKYLFVDFWEGDDAVTAERYGGTLEMLTAAHSSQKAWLAAPSRFPQQSLAPYCQPEHTSYSVTVGSYWTTFRVSSRAQLFRLFDSKEAPGWQAIRKTLTGEKLSLFDHRHVSMNLMCG